MIAIESWRDAAVPSELVAFLRSQKKLDPYLAWALLVNRLGGEGDPALGLLLSFKAKRTAITGLPVLPGYRHALHNAPIATTVWSVITDLRGLADLLSLSMSALSPADAIDAVELAMPRRDIKASELRLYFQPLALLWSQSAVLASQPAKLARSRQLFKTWLGRQKTPVSKALPKRQKQIDVGARPAPLVCVIDDRCNFESAFMRTAGQHRIHSIWHQGDDPQTRVRLEEGGWQRCLEEVPQDPGRSSENSLGAGEEYSGGQSGFRLRIGGAPTQSRVNNAVADEAQESDVYRRTGYIDPSMRWSHGSVVLHHIASTSVWGLDARGHVGWVSRPQAPDAVRFVQLPIPSVIDTSGGSLAGHVIDAIHHAIEEAEPHSHVIVNLSYGTHSGGHDGTSLWDTALRELLDFFDGRKESLGKTLHVVLPAGNNHLMRCHASKLLSNQDRTLRLRWKIQPDNVDDSHLEVWLPPGANVQITVRSPSGDALEATEPAIKLLHNNRVDAALIWPTAVPQSTLGTMVLIAIGPTASRGDRGELTRANVGARSRDATAAHGVWTVTVRSTNTQAAHVHAWVQRGDVPPGRRQQSNGFRGRQSYLLEPECDSVDPRFTLNGIASLKHKRLYVVGAMRRSDMALSPYSASGPNRIDGARFEGPDRVVIADESRNLPGRMSRGLLSGTKLRVSGTSVAAAVFTRMLYEHLLHHPSSESLCGPAPEKASPPEWVPQGAPKHAPGFHRGDAVRLVPDSGNGELPATCRRK